MPLTPPTLAAGPAPIHGSRVLHDLIVVAEVSGSRAEAIRHGVVAMVDLDREVAFLAGRAVGALEAEQSIESARATLAAVVAERVVDALGGADRGDGELASPEAPGGVRARVTEDAILADVAVVERVARRLRRFVRALVNRTVEVVPEHEPPRIDDPTRALARRLLARSGFVRVDR